MVKLESVKYYYTGMKTPALYAIDLEAKSGECICLTGPSGGGKSTILKVINGLASRLYEGKLEGAVYLDGKTTKHMSLEQISRKIGSVFQDARSQFFTSTVYSELAFPMENYGFRKEKMHDFIADISERFSLQNILHRPLSVLSSGERQRTSLGCSIVLGAKVLVLDEPTANLDYHTTIALAKELQTLKKNGYTIIIAEHRLFYLQDLVDRFYIVDDGTIKCVLDQAQMIAYQDDKLRYLNVFKAPYEAKCLQVKPSVQKPVLQIKALNYKQLFKAVDLTINKGEVVALIGKNGVGKTMLARLIMGFEKNKSKQIKCVNQPFYLLQDADYALFTESVRNEVKLGQNDITSEDALDVLGCVGLEEYSKRHPLSLSGGQKQRLLMAIADVYQGELVILDEPTSGLDAANMRKVAQVIERKRQHAGVLLITHDYELIMKVAQTVVYLSEGSIKEKIDLGQNSALYKLKDLFLQLRKENKNGQFKS